ncbi:MAG: YlmC/YmxH family sporulation protein [Blautia sp.]
MRVCELRQKEVINICNCKSLGVPMDVDFDPKTGCIQAIIVPVPGKLCSFFGPVNEFVIPFACIKQIGDDIILVEIQEEKFLKKG